VWIHEIQLTEGLDHTGEIRTRLVDHIPTQVLWGSSKVRGSSAGQPDENLFAIHP
jgi:hypothetical protein